MWRVALVLLIAIPAVSQTSNCDATLPVRVMDLPSQPASEIARHLHIFLDGQEVAPTPAEYGIARRNTFILLDASGSMKSSNLWSLAQDVTRLLVAMTPDGDVRVALFDRELSNFVGRDEISHNGLETFKQFVATDQKRGTTSLFDSIEAAVRTERRATSDDIIIVVTDSGDNASSVKPNRLLRELLDTHVRLFSVLIMPSPDPDLPVVSRVRDDFVDMLLKSGGDVLTLKSLYPSWSRHSADPSGVKLANAAVQTWYTGVRSAFYFQIPPVSHATKIKVELLPKIKNARVLYPHELPACNPRP